MRVNQGRAAVRHFLKAILLGTFADGRYTFTSCCFNGTTIQNPALCEWLMASGAFLESGAPCSPTSCVQTWNNGSQQELDLTLEECFNSDAFEFASISFAFGPDGQGNSVQPWPVSASQACCYLNGPEAACAENLTTIQCYQAHGGVPSSSCDLCSGLGACFTGASLCNQTLLADCPLFALSSVILDSGWADATVSFQGVGGWQPGGFCNQQANESVWEFFAGTDCSGEASLLATQRSIESNEGILYYWTRSVTWQGRPLFWWVRGVLPTLPLDCILLSDNGTWAVVDGQPVGSARLRGLGWWWLHVSWELGLCALLGLACLGPAILAERRWRWLRSQHQPTAVLVRVLAIFFWLCIPRNFTLVAALRQELAHEPGAIALLVFGAGFALAVDFVFSLFLILFARRAQEEKNSYTREPWRRLLFFFTQVLPLVLLPSLSSALIFPSVIVTNQRSTLLGLLTAGLALSMLPVIILGIRLDGLVRYTMRVLPFRRTRLWLWWLTTTGLLFGLEHFGFAYFSQHTLRRDWGGFLLPFALAMLPAGGLGWLVLLWPPLNHSVSLAVPGIWREEKPSLERERLLNGDSLDSTTQTNATI